MNTRKSTKTTIAALTTGLALASVLVATPAEAKTAGKVRTGNCSAATNWKVKVSPDNGRLQVEGEIDSNRNGQTWRWALRHNGSLSAHGTRVTRAPSGAFTVRRLMVNRAGTDTVTLRARNPQTGEVCRGTVRF